MGAGGTGGSVLGLETRRRLFAQVQAYPGLHVRELARQLDMSVALVEYHLQVLHANDLVRVQDEPGFKRVYPAGIAEVQVADKDRVALAVLRKRIPLRITLFLLDHGRPASHGTMAQQLDLGKSKLSFHLRALEKAGVVRRADDGHYEAVGAKRLLALLLQSPPTPDLRREFGRLWLSLYGDE